MSENFNNDFDKDDHEDNQIFNKQHHNQSENIYIKQYEQDQLAELEENAPQLNAPINREVNKKAIVFIILAGFGLAGLGAFAYQQLSGPEEPPPPERVQVVTVPELPPIQEPIVNNEASSAIPLADTIKEQPASSVKVNSVEPPIQLSPPVVSTPNIPIQSPGPSLANEGESSFVQDGEAQDAATATAKAVRYMHNKDKLLVQGTYLRCILETKIVSEVPGFTSCVITEPVYSASGKYLLLPKGSKVMGQYGSSNPTSGRLSVIWDRIITPEGVDVTLKSPGVDNLGAAGHVGKFSSHWPSRLASALLISMISDTFKYAAAEYGPQGETVTTSTSTVTSPYESETADTLKQFAINQLERNNLRPNTVTINQGSLINIYTAQDIDFSTVIQ